MGRELRGCARPGSFARSDGAPTKATIRRRGKGGYRLCRQLAHFRSRCNSFIRVHTSLRINSICARYNGLDCARMFPISVAEIHGTVLYPNARTRRVFRISLPSILPSPYYELSQTRRRIIRPAKGCISISIYSISRAE